MLDNVIKTQLKTYLEKLQRPIELVATLDESAKAGEIRELLADIAGLSGKVSLRQDGNAAALAFVGDAYGASYDGDANLVRSLLSACAAMAAPWRKPRRRRP